MTQAMLINKYFTPLSKKTLENTVCLSTPTTTKIALTLVVATCNTLFLWLFANTAHVHDLLLVSVWEVELIVLFDRGRNRTL